MFETITSTSTGFNTDGITDSTKNFAVDFYKNWIITINNVEYQITGNTKDTLLFKNNLTANISYKIDFVTRNSIGFFDDQILNLSLVPSDLLLRKIEVTKKTIEQKIYAYFRNQFANFDDPSALILNLFQMQTCFSYYCLAEIFSDLLLTGQDINGYKEEKYRSAYKDLIKDCLNLLALDTDGSGELTGEEKEDSVGDGGYFAR